MSSRTRGVAASLATAALLAGLLLVCAAPAGAAGLKLRDCGQLPSDDCGRVVVPLDRSGALPGRIGLRVRVLGPDLGGADGAGKGTVLALAGGPGQAATPLIHQIGASLGRPLRTRRLVAFDQRGTGRSGRLRCPGLGDVERRAQIVAAVGGCARRLGARRTAYTTAASVDDIEAVRQALGVERMTIYAVSYGTKVALGYAAKYPQHVSRLVLDSVVPPSGNDPFQRATLAAVPSVLAQICAGRACPFTRDPGDDVATLVRQLATRPLRGRWFDGRGRPHRARLRSEDLLMLLLAGDLELFQRTAMPAAIRAAVEGDAAQLLQLVHGPLAGGGGGGRSRGDSDALFLATSCADGGVPWPAGTPIAQRPAATDAALAAIPDAELAPLDRRTLRRSGLELCQAWPESPIAQPVLPLADVPTLILSGDQDLRTPRSDALALAAKLPRAQVVAVPRIGHSVLGSSGFDDDGRCATEAVRLFFLGRLRGDPCAGVERRLPVRPLAPASLAAVNPRRGLPPRVGRTAHAFELTFEQFSYELGRLFMASGTGSSGGAVEVGVVGSAAGAARGREPVGSFGIGGLRGGSVRFTRDAIRLVDYSYVPGVTVTGTIVHDEEDEPESILFRIGGRAAALGTLRVSARKVVGRLGGHRVVLTEPFEGEARVSAAGGPGVASRLHALLEDLAAR